VAHLLVAAGLRREESRGGHTRLDFPETSPIGEHTLSPAGADSATPAPLALPEGAIR
jgi:L-aspartate oxidase